MASPIDPCRGTNQLENEKFREADAGGVCVAVCIEEGDVNIGSVNAQGTFNSTPPTITDGAQEDLQLDVNGNLKVTQSQANTTPSIFNVTLGPADTEQSQALPANTKEFIVKTRGNTLLKLSYTATESGTKYVTIPKQGVYTDNNFYTSQTIYFQSPSTGDVVEIVAYS